ncbi:Conserved_hypothetical protein [Hexamita inflata]|uniref:Uncharacterized protein n=1 Tax=Hexamita inflata TaxID=28002 RepID=A0AA86Q7P4_9EUKA|nr:Conserved hypothetical protein [Hexamita inflata]
MNNISEIENRIIYNYFQSDQNLLINTSILDSRIFSNFTDVKKDIIVMQIKADENLLLNTTIIDWRIFNNISILNTTIQNLSQQIREMNNSLQYQNEIITQQKQLVDNLTQQLNCTSSQGYSLINGSCIQVTCAISGQQSINGICQCTNINSIIQQNSCVCPANSNVIGTACVCSIIGQTMQNGKCICSTNGAFADNNVCTCGLNSFNISNTCSCPNGANLVNGVCTCSNINAYISGDKCVCPTYSSLIGNTCTCPSNSQIVNNECICNLIIGLIMSNSVCQCQTSGAFVNNGMCICGQYALNFSNTCTCPTNSILVNNICTCDKIKGQYIINNSCQCQSGYSIVNNSCQKTHHSIIIPNFECSQEFFTSSFNIQNITNQISASSNFSSGYVFSSSTVIQNAFIDISDNVYTITVYPLFQSQNIFINLKIQFGTQLLQSGSLILTQSSVQINQMTIVSRLDSQLTVNSAKQLNILTSSSTSSNLTNLLVNLSFAPSGGNIALINNINGVLNISGYQILGSFVSTGTVSMIGLNVNIATIYVNKVSFSPTMYNVGNGSSYLFANAISTSSFICNNIALVLGSSLNYLVFGSVTSSLSNYFQFGGILTNIQSNINCIVNVNNIILDSYQKFSTNYVNYSGFLVGFIQSRSGNVIIKNICLQQNMISKTLAFKYLGLVGFNYGNALIQNASIIFSAQQECVSGLGVIGIQEQDAQVINLRICISFIVSQGGFVGSIFGAPEGQNCSILNTTVVGGNIISSLSQYYFGGFCGYVYEVTNMTIFNSTISQTNISGTAYIGGLIGFAQSTIYIINSKIQLVHLTSSSSVGIVFGVSSGVYSFIGSASSSNYINGVLQRDCTVLSNIWSVVGC